MADAGILRRPLTRGHAMQQADAPEELAVVQNGQAEQRFDLEFQLDIPLRTGGHQAGVRGAETFTLQQNVENGRQEFRVGGWRSAVGFLQNLIEPDERLPPGLVFVFEKTNLAAVQ